MHDSLTQTKQETAGRITVIILDVLIGKERNLNHAIGSGETTFLCVQENGSVSQTLQINCKFTTLALYCLAITNTINDQPALVILCSKYGQKKLTIGSIG